MGKEYRIDELIDSEELYHHGIKGQKWGVRRFQNKDGSLTAAGKKRYAEGEHGDFMGQDRDNDIRIKTGSDAYRLQSKDKLRGSGQSYISLDKLDHLKYINVTAAGNSGLLINATSDDPELGHSIKMKVDNELVIPAYNKSIDAFIKASKKVGLEELAKQVERPEYSGKQFVKDMRNISVTEARDRAYKHFMGTLMRDSKAKTEFFDSLKKQGYNAVIDEWDVDFGKGFAKSSVVVFEQSDVKQVGSKRLDEWDAEYAYNPDWFNKSDNENAKKVAERWKNY